MADARQRDALWYKDAIIYELHVRAFFDSSGDGVGDFNGLISKLDYLQDLGVTAIWLLPFYPSPLKDDGYDIADYRGVHADYGTIGDFRRFVREAHRRNLRVITELVINHTSDQHPWFQAARRAGPGSARRDFYVWSDTDKKFPETRIIFSDTETSNWAWDQQAGAYYWHRFFSHQPDLNHNNPRVVDAVVKVMQFWFDMGVDGMRLDAVPYLCVREGTNNENLPETHAVIKEFRRRLDERYQSRMLLAEANQWPDDVRPYFGDSDEAHMAFHFPLMPRIFIGLRREDRFPIVDILKRTPPIPDDCQWAIFLRNHDELTLEMVTDEERDYMYREYAKDRQMRLNLGIRRRLAPLVDNSARRIELLNSLLLSLPGTPVIYYGDEIGMGDNIYLGDRNGVRTPMQWSADRNAGFSRADPAQLYLPVIMDPVYGYQAVNVEAQQRSQSSRLQFMKRLIALRRQHRAFAWGRLELLEPENRSVLAYLRRYRGETILAVANLSRFAQAVELDLREFNGRTPLELFGRNEFPRIGELPYLLTLGPHGFLWFRLESQAHPIPLGRRSERAPLPIPTLPVDRGPDRPLDAEHRYRIENDVLPAFLPRQRWFRSKARDVTEIRVTDQAKLGSRFYVVFATVRYADGGSETYSLPVRVAWGGLAESVERDIPESIICRITSDGEDGVMFDALADQTACRDLLHIITDARRFPTTANGRIAASTTRAMARGALLDAEAVEVTRMAAEQSNTSVVLGRELILKWFRKVELGPNPDLEIGAFLTERSAFEGVPPVLGGIEYAPPQGEQTAALAMLQTFAENEGDGWRYAVDSLAWLLGSVDVAELEPARPMLADELIESGRRGAPDELVQAGGYLADIALLGERTAELHLALAGDPRDPAFAPEPLTQAALVELAESFLARGQGSLGLLDSRIGELPAALRERAETVLAARPGLLRRFQSVRELEGGAGQRIRCHGDYHLGQVLRTRDDFLILDFEGEPLVALAERLRKASPLKDVAGMLRSFSYASHEAAARHEEDYEVRRRSWELWSAATFLGAYLNRASAAAFLPERRALAVLLDAFMLDKALYELGYELNNRPEWVHLPLAGIAAFVESPPPGETGGDHE